jgi:hypothetical protein
VALAALAPSIPFSSAGPQALVVAAAAVVEIVTLERQRAALAAMPVYTEGVVERDRRTLL